MLKRDIPVFLAKIGVSYHATGTIDQIRDGKRVKIHDFFKVDKLTQDQKSKIELAIKDCKFFTSQSQYAPEIRKVLICIPKKAYYKIMAGKK